MVTLILGKTLIFWSGNLAVLSFTMMLSTCSCIAKKSFGAKMHKYFVTLTVILVIIHVSLALLSSLFDIWI